MNLALADVHGGVLVVSQFTLYGDVQKGRRPASSTRRRRSSPSAVRAVRRLAQERGAGSGTRVETGEFGP